MGKGLMPPIEEQDLHQRAVLWEKTGHDAANEPTLGEPEDLWVRWLDTYREATAPDGTTIILEAKVISTQEIPVGSLLWKAPLANEEALEQWYDSGSSGDSTRLMEVRTVGMTPSLDGRVIRYEYGLSKFRDTLPG